MPDPSIIFYKGLRCSKVPRTFLSTATISSATTFTPPANSSVSAILTPTNSTSISTSASASILQGPLAPASVSSAEPSLSTETLTSHIPYSPDPTSTTTSTTSTDPGGTKASSTYPATTDSITSNTSSTDSVTTSIASTTTQPPFSISSTTSLTASTSESSSRSESESSSQTPVPTTSGSVEHQPLVLSSTTTTSRSALSTSKTQSLPSTSHSTTSGGPVFEPTLSHNASGQQRNTNKTKDTLRTVLGSVLGSLAFLALALFICFIIYRRRRRKPRGGKSLGAGETVQQIDRDSGRSSVRGHVRDRSDTSFLSAPSSTYSRSIHAPHLPEASVPFRPNRDLNPFSDSAEIPSESKLDSRGVFCEVQDPFVDPTSTNDQPTMRQVSLPKTTIPHPLSLQRPGAKQPGSQLSPGQASDLSYGSTIILPGRNSLVSFLGVGYPISMSSPRSARAPDSVTRTSTRSDPFDLEYSWVLRDAIPSPGRQV